MEASGLKVSLQEEKQSHFEDSAQNYEPKMRKF